MSFPPPHLPYSCNCRLHIHPSIIPPSLWRSAFPLNFLPSLHLLLWGIWTCFHLFSFIHHSCNQSFILPSSASPSSSIILLYTHPYICLFSFPSIRLTSFMVPPPSSHAAVYLHPSVILLSSPSPFSFFSFCSHPSIIFFIVLCLRYFLPSICTSFLSALHLPFPPVVIPPLIPSKYSSILLYIIVISISLSSFLFISPSLLHLLFDASKYPSSCLFIHPIF